MLEDLKFVEKLCERVIKDNYPNEKSKQLEVNFLKGVLKLMIKYNFNNQAIYELQQIIYAVK
jgi:hypothetical protein